MKELTKIVLEYKLIEGITSDMLDWWWENMESTDVYKLWHPDHISTKWELRTNEPGLIGSIRIVEERVGEDIVKLRIRTDPRDKAIVETTFKGALVGTSLNDDDSFAGQVIHEYQDIPGGIEYKTTFLFPEDFPKEFLEGIRTHSYEETMNLAGFLPDLYRQRNSQ